MTSNVCCATCIHNRKVSLCCSECRNHSHWESSDTKVSDVYSAEGEPDINALLQIMPILDRLDENQTDRVLVWLNMKYKE